MKFDIKDIAAALGCDAPLHDMTVDELLIDSRLAIKPATSLFVALRTNNNDGHHFIKPLIEAGVTNFVVDATWPLPDDAGEVNFLRVDDTLQALQRIGSLCRERIHCPVVGITGSRGKTLVKEWIYQSLGRVIRVGRSPRSFNSQIGVPLSLWSIDPDSQLAVIEAGVSQAGEMKRLAAMIRPEVGILTDITDEHDEGFGSREEKIMEKAQLFAESKAIIHGSHDRAVNNIHEALYPSKRLIEVSTTADEPTSCRRYVNALISLLSERGILKADAAAEARAALSNVYDVKTRLNVIDGLNNCRLICDRFTADTPSLRGAMDFMLRQVGRSGRRTLILATDNFDGTPDEIAETVADYGVDRLITIGRSTPEIAAPTHKHLLMADQLASDDFYNESVVIKCGSDGTLEPLYRMLEAKQHETLLEVNLDAIVHNFNYFRSKVKPTTGVICMLKAQGYGAGSIELARTLQSQGAAYLAVAVVDEGVELRQAGITMPIMVLNPRAQNYKVMFDNRLEPEIYSFDMLDEIIDSARRHSVTNYQIHIKLETGMRRLGFVEEEMEELARRLSQTPHLKASTVFSHLAAADDPQEDDYTLGQFATFDRCCRRLEAGLPYPIKRHILNSTGIIRFPEMQYDYVRLGIGLYGVATLFDGEMDGLQTVSTLTTPIISIKHWKARDTVGYNRRGLLVRDSVIATLPIGYADGIDRHLGYGNAAVLINGHRCPTVGSICMDICMVDVTDAPCRVGDRAEIFGPNIAPQELADRLGTIPYEILTSISPRVKRVYYRD